MKKKIGIDGEINVMKLAEELGDLFQSFEIDPNTKECFLTFKDSDETKIDEIIKTHDPTPSPEPKTEMELLGEKVELLDGTLTEVLFNIIPTLQGGV